MNLMFAIVLTLLIDSVLQETAVVEAFSAGLRVLFPAQKCMGLAKTIYALLRAIK